MDDIRVVSAVWFRVNETVSGKAADESASIRAKLALGDAVKDLERLRERLTQDMYFASDMRLI